MKKSGKKNEAAFVAGKVIFAYLKHFFTILLPEIISSHPDDDHFKPKTMTREEHLRYCRVCENKGFDARKGIVCKLTGDIAGFEVDCASFTGDRNAIAEEAPAIVKRKKATTLPLFLRPFIPTSSFFITPALSYVNILVFLVMVISGVHAINPDIDQLVEWGANYKPVTLENQYWRLFSNIFIHIGILHLLVNTYAMLYVGMFLEKIIGWHKTLLAYFITGLSASVLSLWWYDNVVSAGASGAIFGLYGVYMALLMSPLKHQKMDKKALPSMLLFVVYNLIYGMQPGIDNAAHLGGLFSGLLLGFTFVPSLKMEISGLRSWFPYVGTCLLIVAISTFFTLKMPNNVGRYNQIMEEYIAFEQQGLQIYDRLEYWPPEKSVDMITTKSIPSFEEALKILDRMDRELSNIPVDVAYRINLLRDYTNLRIKHLELIAKSLESDNTAYSYLIDETAQRIASLFAKLTGREMNLKAEAEFEEDVHQTPAYPEAQNAVPTNGKPLYVVDGIPTGNELTVEPQQIKSLQVLSDSVAKLQYGADGQNGVILISTQP